MAKCLRCGADAAWIQGQVPDEPVDDFPQWQPGPPTEPGNYITKWKQSPAQFCEWTADDLKAQVALIEIIDCHYGPIPIPQPPEVTP